MSRSAEATEAAAGPPDVAAAAFLATAEVPLSTYRLQLHAGFDLNAASSCVGHLHRLGVTHLYASPLLAARPGSRHGYDGVDFTRLNPELGDEAAFAALTDVLRAHGMGLVLDIVPNHMAVLAAAGNEWWLDVLANGPAAAHAPFFDIEWSPPQRELAGKVLLPVLGQPYGRALEAGEIVPAFDADRGAFSLHYFEHRFPITLDDHAALLAAVPLPQAAAPSDIERAAVASIIEGCARLPPRDTPDAVARATRQREVASLNRALAELHAHAGWAAQWLADCAAALAGRPGDSASWDRLDALVQRQAWRLAHWRAAGDELNYRRFFDVDALAGLRVERPEVFDAVHARLLEWTAQGRVQALRIDHPDGMADPPAYFRRLQERAAAAAAARARRDAPGEGAQAPARAVWVVAETILGDEEAWPEAWAVHGDTGYRFANQALGLFVDGANEAAFDALTADFVGRAIDFGAELDAAKRTIMAIALAADLRLLTELAHDLALRHRASRDFTRPGLRAAIVELTAAFDVYRTYIGEAGEATPGDRARIERCAALARSRCRPSLQEHVAFIRALLLERPGDAAAPAAGDEERACRTRFVRRWQQFTAPVMAKAMEDTAFYRHHRLVALNDVGGDPRRFGLDAAAFHAANGERARRTPRTMLGSSTHDSKRSEDVRARLAVLSEMPAAWAEALRRWHELAAAQWHIASVEPPAERNDELLLFQTLVGVWPAGHEDAAACVEPLRERVAAYMLKAAREAKQASSWLDTDEAHERALERAVQVLLARLEPNPFLSDLRAFVDRIAPFGCVNSLALLALKITSPGVPDFYQGNEDWQQALVDPDNRRAVDWGCLGRRLEAADAMSAQALAGRPLAGGLHKLFVTARLLRWRRDVAAGLLREGDYVPLAADGRRAANVVAFLRRRGEQACLTVVPRLAWTACEGRIERLTGGDCWNGTTLPLPEGAPRRWCDVLSGRRVEAEGGSTGLPVAAVLRGLCVAVLQPDPGG
ncbi:MAG: malto-oligosyltrehalose synthase [Rubrivivax sp.]|nr:malto-oligosyltrehalose synthase [Rubrivivax sp.]